MAAAAPGAHLRRIEEQPGLRAGRQRGARPRWRGRRSTCSATTTSASSPTWSRSWWRRPSAPTPAWSGAKVVEWDQPGPHPPGGHGGRQDRGPGPAGRAGRARPGAARRGPRRLLHPRRPPPWSGATCSAPLGGFDPDIELLGEDLDLSWRAHVVGRPGAGGPRRPHRSPRGPGPTPAGRRSPPPPDAPSPAHQPGGLHPLVAGPGDPPGGAAGTGGVPVRGGHRPVRPRRPTWWRPGPGTSATGPACGPGASSLAAHRTVADRDVRRLQVRGSARLAAFLRGQLGLDESRLGDNRLGFDDRCRPRSGHQPSLGQGPLLVGGLGGRAGPAGLREPGAAHRRHPGDRPVRGLSRAIPRRWCSSG